MMPEPQPSENIFPDVRENTLLGGRVRLLQPKTGYRTAIDGVLLAAAVDNKMDDIVIDVGAGVGTASLCLQACRPADKIIGLELHQGLVNLANQNARLNGWHPFVHYIQGDLKTPPSFFQGLLVDQVMMNPPYYRSNELGRKTENLLRGQALYEGGSQLIDWLGFAWRHVKSKGVITLIHVAHRLPEILAFFQEKTCAIKVFPLWPDQQKSANRVLVQIMKGAKTPFSLYSGLVLHTEDGSYTLQAEGVLRHGQKIDWL